MRAPFLGERFGDAFADAGGTAGDQRYFVLQLQVHKFGLVLLFVYTRTMVEIAPLGRLSSARQPTLNGKSSAVDPAERRWPHESRTFRELLPPGELKRSKGKYL